MTRYLSVERQGLLIGLLVVMLIGFVCGLLIGWAIAQ